MVTKTEAKKRRRRARGAADPLGPGVDGGGRNFGIADRRLQAGAELMHLRRELGRDMTELLVRVAGHGEAIRDVASSFAAAGASTSEQHAQRGTGWMFRVALGRAAAVFGNIRATGRAHAPTRAWLGEGARPLDVLETGQRDLDADERRAVEIAERIARAG